MSLSIGELVGYVRLDTAGVKQGADETVRTVEGIGTRGKAAAVAVGGLLGLSLGAAITETLDVSGGRAKLTAQLDSTPAEAAKYGGAAGKLYSSAYGENLGEVNDAIAGVVRNIGGMADASSADLERISGKVLNTAQAFDQDLGQVTRTVGTMMRTGMAADADEALDIITAGLQSNANTADDLLDTYSEYSTQFRKVGLDGKDALGLIQQGLQGGARDADIVADAVKEFSIRAVDGSKEAAASYAALGFNAGEMTAKIAAGGPAAKEAFGQVLTRLRETKGQADYATIAFGLFGTQSEDLGEALAALDLQTASRGLDDVAGAADRVDDALGNNAQAAVSSFMRSMQTGVVDILGDTAIPLLEEGADTAANVFGPALEGIGTVAGGVADLLGAVPEPIRDTVLVMGALVAFKGPINDTYRAIASSVTSMSETVALKWMYAREQATVGAAGVAAAGGVARAGMAGFMTMLGGPVGLAIAGVTLGLSLLSSATDDNAGTTEQAARAQSDLADALRESNGVIDDNVRLAAAKELQEKGLLDIAERAGISTERMVDAYLNQSGALDEVTQALWAYNAAHTDSRGATTATGQAAAVMDDEARAALDAATQLQNLAGTVPETAEKEGQLAEAVGESAAEHHEAADAAKAQDEALQHLKDTFDEWTGKAISVAEAQIDVNDGLRAFTENIEKNGTSLEANTAAGDANRSQVLDQIKAVQDLSTAVFDQTGSVEDARKAYEDEMGALRQRLLELGYNEQAVDDMIAKYAQIPEEEWTKVYADTGPAEANLEAFLSKRRTLQVKVALQNGTPLVIGGGLFEAIGGIVKKYAEGGIELSPMSGGLAQIVPPNTPRVIGDRVIDDEFYIPDNDDARSLAIGAEWARRRGFDLVPADVMAMATGAVATSGPVAAPASATHVQVADGDRTAPLVHIDNYHEAPGSSAYDNANALAVEFRTRGGGWS